jgi:poly(A) polymerase
VFKIYQVGGSVRDEILGVKSKDIDFVAVPSEELISKYSEASDMFSVLVSYLKSEGYELFLITENCFTIRGKFPKNNPNEGLVADFVMSRRETGYIPNTRTPIIKPGTLFDDLQRRDFTLNALAKDDDGTIIDYFGGIKDLDDKILRTPLSPIKTFDDDGLRIIRCVRFSITKGFSIPYDITNIIKEYDYETKMRVVSIERIREELFKCFKFDTIKTIEILQKYPKLFNYIFKDNVLWLKPTMEL